MTKLWILLAVTLAGPVLPDAALQSEAWAPIQITGQISLGASAEWVAGLDLGLRPGLAQSHAGQATLQVVEQRFRMGIESGFFVQRGGSRTSNLFDLNASLLRAEPSTHLHVWGQPGSTASLEGSCQIGSGRADPADRERFFRADPVPLGRALLQADCQVAGFAARGEMVWRLWNVTARLEYAERSGAQRAIKDLVTGETIEPDPTIPGAFDRVQRVALLHLPKDARLNWPSSPRLVLRAPGFAADGELALPAQSRTRWAETVFDNQTPAPTPQGAFEVSRAGQTIALAGHTDNAPSLALPWSTQAAPLALGIAAAGLVALAAWGLFARLGRAELAEHPVRREVLQFLGTNPGSTLTELRRHIPCSRSAMVHHLRTLERGGLVVTERVGRSFLFALRRDFPKLQDPLFLAARVGRQHLLMQILYSYPGLSQSQIARRMGITQSYVSRLLKELRRRGVGPDARTSHAGEAVPPVQ